MAEIDIDKISPPTPTVRKSIPEGTGIVNPNVLSEAKQPKQPSPNPRKDNGSHLHNPNDVRFYLGSDGLLHNIGQGIIGAFLGPQAGKSFGGALGGLEDTIIGPEDVPGNG